MTAKAVTPCGVPGHHRALARLASTLLVATLLAACAPGGGAGGGTGGGVPGDVDGVDLDGSWHLVAGSDASGALVLAGRTVTLVVDGGEANGTSACNMYFATVDVDGDAVRFSGVGGTEMGCDPAVMELEQRYVAALTAVDRAVRDGGTLTLTGPDVTLDLELDAPVEDAPLVGTEWTLDSLVSGDAVSSVLPGGLLVLDEGGTLTGSSGCRSFEARYETSGDSLVVRDLEEDPTAGACEPDAEAQHRHVVDVLAGEPTLEVAGDRLTLTARDGAGLTLRAQS